jgi:hypothetical protein
LPRGALPRGALPRGALPRGVAVRRGASRGVAGRRGASRGVAVRRGASRGVAGRLGSVERWGVLEGLEDDAVALGQLEELGYGFGWGVGVEIELELDATEADWRFARDAERASEVELTFGANRGRLDGDAHRGGDRAERDTGAADERLEEHVSGTSLAAVPTGRSMQAGRAAAQKRFDVADLGRRFDAAPSGQGDDRGGWLGLVLGLERRLRGPELVCVHVASIGLPVCRPVG